jgi:hypothetical protein
MESNLIVYNYFIQILGNQITIDNKFSPFTTNSNSEFGKLIYIWKIS